MKTLFIKAKSSQDVRLTSAQITGLPKPVGIVATAQYEHKIAELQKKLKRSVNLGTILGCRIFKAENAKVNSFLFIGTGEFHPIMIAMKTGKPVFVLNPFDSKLSQIDSSQVDQIKKRQKVNLVKYLQAETIGILVSTKPGQQNLKKALALQKKLTKKTYLFLDDTFKLDSLQNFPFIDCYVNTACPRIIEDSSFPLVNIDDVLE